MRPVPPRTRTAPIAPLLLVPILAFGPLTAACADAQVGEAGGIGDVRVFPCEGCEAVVVGMPDYDAIPSRVRIAPADEPGEPLVITGTVYDGDGEPAAGIVIYAYHTDATGVYPPDDRYTGWARRHGRLRAWARTDADGRYRFATIRPASYPSGTEPQHVHMHIIEPDCCAYYVSSVHFTDDPLIPDGQEPDPDARGGPGLVTPHRQDGVWHVERDIWLGRNVDGYR